MQPSNTVMTPPIHITQLPPPTHPNILNGGGGESVVVSR